MVLYDQKYKKVLFGHAGTQTASYNKKQMVFHQGDVFGSSGASRRDTITNKHSDGKVGIWPFTIIETAKRNSRNRAAGTPVIRSKNSITTDQYCNMLIYHVLPVIKIKWRGNLSGTIIKIQQDNARPHIEPSDKEFLPKHLKWD